MTSNGSLPLNQETQPTPSRALVWSSYALLIWSVAYGVLHFLWALDIALAMLRTSAIAIPYFKVINLVTGGLLCAVGFLGLLLIYFRHQRFISWSLLVICLIGCSLATSHGMYGIAQRILQVVGVIEVESGPFNPTQHAYVLWDLFVFEPWFTIEGILLAIVGWYFLDTLRNQRIWLVLSIIAVILGLISGLLGVRIG